MKRANTTFTTTLIERKWLSRNAYELRCTRPDGFSFRSGQHISMLVGEDERDYTIVSPESEQELVLLIKELENGKVSKKLAEMELGKKLEIKGPDGYLVERPTQKKRVLVATGTGIAPFASLVANGMEAVVLLHGARCAEELYYRHILTGVIPTYMPCLSGESCREQNGPCYEGYVTGYIEDLLPAGDYDFYLCGKWDMIKDVTHVIDARFPDASIYSEGFY